MCDLQVDLHCLRLHNFFSLLLCRCLCSRISVPSFVSFQASARCREAFDELKVSELMKMDLAKKLAEREAKLKQCKHQFTSLKTQRNHYAHLTQGSLRDDDDDDCHSFSFFMSTFTIIYCLFVGSCVDFLLSILLSVLPSASAQELSEMKERIKLLSNEVEILRAECLAKERQWLEEQRRHHKALNARAALKIDENKCNRQKDEGEEKVFFWHLVLFAYQQENGRERRSMRTRDVASSTFVPSPSLLFSVFFWLRLRAFVFVSLSFRSLFSLV